MEYQYKKALKEHGLDVSDLTDDAITGIETLNDIDKAISMLAKSGKKPTQKTLNKAKALDKWVYYEILDIVNDTDENDEEMPEVEIETETVAQSKPTPTPTPKPTPAPAAAAPEIGTAIEAELDKLFKAGIKQIGVEDLKAKASKTYSVIFDTYENGGENGVVTSTYSLIENKDKKFDLSLTAK